MKPVLGIDIGTQKVAVAVHAGGRTHIVPLGRKTTTIPTLVAFKKGGVCLVGEAAAKQALTKPTCTYTSFRRYLGITPGNRRARPSLSCQSYKLVKTPEGKTGVVDAQGRAVPFRDLLVALLEHVLETCDAYAKMEIREAVLSVPSKAVFNFRHEITEAARAAGLKVLGLFEESVADSLSHLRKSAAAQRTLVVDVGAGVTDASVISSSNRTLEIIYSDSDRWLGGDDYDQRICDWILEQCHRDGLDTDHIDPATRLRLTQHAERVKLDLARRSSCKVDIPYLFFGRRGPYHFQRTFTRELLEKLTRDLNARMIGFINRVLSNAHVLAKTLDAVILAGGQSAMPGLAKQIERALRRPLSLLNRGREHAAVGCALRAELLCAGRKTLTVRFPTKIQPDRYAPGSLIEGRFQVLGRVGSGAFSYIYKVVDKQDNKIVAVKVLKPEYNDDENVLGRFITAAQRLIDVRHANLLRIDEIIRGSSLNIIRMEYVEGETLQAMIDSGRFAALELHQQLAIFDAILRALIALRRRDMYHGDLKPENVLIDKQGRVKLFDFDLVRYGFVDPKAHQKVTGTPKYMSPEHMAPPETFGEWSEIYSLGLIMYLAFTGQFPRKSEDPKKEYLIFDFSGGTPIHPCKVNPELPRELGEVIFKAIRRKRSERHQRYEELIEELQRVSRRA